MDQNQYEWLKSVLGERVPDRSIADSEYARLGTLRLVALQYLRQWRTELIDSVTSFSVSGGVAVSFSENIRALERTINDIENGPDDPTIPGEDGPDNVLGVIQTVPDFHRGGGGGPWVRKDWIRG